MQMIIGHDKAEQQNERAKALQDAYTWGNIVRESGGCFETDWALFLAQFGGDEVAQERFVAGYSGM